MKKLGTTHENLDHKVYKALKTMILGRRLTPGSKIYQMTATVLMLLVTTYVPSLTRVVVWLFMR